MSAFRVPLIIRGEVIEDDWVTFGGRDGIAAFSAPDPHKYITQLRLRTPMDLRDMYDVSFEEILDVLQELGERLRFDSNRHMQDAYEASVATSDLTPAVLRHVYEQLLPNYFQKDSVREIAERGVGINHLEGWVEHTLGDGRKVRVRAFGARTLHIAAGNGPVISAFSIIRNAITRGDAIIKMPSNDPLTGVAVARTLVDMAPNHPVTKHISTAYWKGGDAEFEAQLYRPENLEKIVAWGGFASVKHVTRYIQPGLELISFDPKNSASIIGKEAFASEATLREVASRLALDIGIANQNACTSARVIYVFSGADDDGLQKLTRLGELIYEAMLALPEFISTKPKRYDPELREQVDALRLDDEWFHVIGGEAGEGAVIVSRISEAVDFAPMLSCRTANLVPVDDLTQVTGAVTAYTQTVGIYPDSLKEELRDRLPLFGAQRLVSLGFASRPSLATPQDGMEPMRRMCKWIVDESCDWPGGA
jgi:hypothetical protein